MTTLYFGGSTGGSTRFPTIGELKLRCDAERTTAIEPMWQFIESVEAAQWMVWVLDLHFDEIGLHPLADALMLSRAQEVRLLTGKLNDRRSFTELLQLARQAAGFDRGSEAVFWCDTLNKRGYPFPHDRFAIADDALWHFGHTVGGAGRRMVAASGAWDAPATDTPRFFRSAWDAVAPPNLKFARERR